MLSSYQKAHRRSSIKKDFRKFFFSIAYWLNMYWLFILFTENQSLEIIVIFFTLFKNQIAGRSLWIKKSNVWKKQIFPTGRVFLTYFRRTFPLDTRGQAYFQLALSEHKFPPGNKNSLDFYRYLCYSIFEIWSLKIQ